jgi:flagellar motility protein MotE (MotC chaperone)
MKFRVPVLPLLVVVSMMSFAVRLGEFWDGMHPITGAAYAQEAVKADPPPMPANAQKPGALPMPPIATAKASPGDAVAVPVPAAKTAQPATAGSPDSQAWKDATEEQYNCSDTEEKLNQDLAKRRDDLDRQARELTTRQALLDAGQHELDQKVSELTNLKGEIQGMMGQLNDQQQARIQSMVKIYESMKPDDAARIFNTLDTDVVIQLMSQMKEVKAAAVLAAMDVDRAKTVTVMLAQQKKLPDVPK